MSNCPECGSADIVSELLVFSDEALAGLHPPYVRLVEPRPEKVPFIWVPKSVSTGFRASICGNCGLTRFYTKQHAEILDAQRKGYRSQPFATSDILPV